MDTPITRAEHEEFRRRMEEENKRQDKRIELLEKAQEQNNKLILSVERLATNMENMLREQEHQGERLEELEDRDGAKWRRVIDAVIVALIGAAIGFVAAKLGFK